MTKPNSCALGILLILGLAMPSWAEDTPPAEKEKMPVNDKERKQGASKAVEKKEKPPSSVEGSEGPSRETASKDTAGSKEDEKSTEILAETGDPAVPPGAGSGDEPRTDKPGEILASSEGTAASEIDESELEDAEVPEVEPFAKGDMEAALNLAMAGSGDYFYFGAGASYSYYVIDRLAPGIEINYTHVFLNQDFGYEEPHTMTMLPFLKFVVMRSRSVAPYIVAAAGYQAEWGSDVATNAWIVGGGGGVHVGLGKHFALNIQLLALYYWYGDKRVYSYRDGGVVNVEKNDYVCSDTGKCDRDFEGDGSFYAAPTGGADGFPRRDSNTGKTASFVTCEPNENGVMPPECAQSNTYRCNTSGEYCAAPYSDPGDKRRELFFPLITFGVTYFF